MISHAQPLDEPFQLRQLLRPVARWALRNTPDIVAIQLKYLQKFGRLAHLRRPRTLNEKIAWRKLHQHNPLFSVFADKVAVKARIAELAGPQHIIETLWVGEEPEAIPFDQLKPPYVIKTNHGSGGIIFVRTEAEADQAAIIASLRDQIAHPYGHDSRERAYLDIPRRVLIERMIETPDGAPPQDFKFFVYHGRAHFIQVDTNRFTGHRRTLFDRDWNRLPAILTYPPERRELPKPAELDEMITLAEKIGAQFDFVRVDLYSVKQGILFGEVTFYPNAGLERFAPAHWDVRFGEPWKLE
jgi:hypothetical protein